MSLIVYKTQYKNFDDFESHRFPGRRDWHRADTSAAKAAGLEGWYGTAE